MKRMADVFIGTCLALLLLSVPALAASDVVETVTKGCDKELSTYCKDVTPGEGRVLACLYAHNDKLTNKCEYALYDAAVQLQRFVAALTYVVNECRDDLKTYCTGVEEGDARVEGIVKGMHRQSFVLG